MDILRQKLDKWLDGIIVKHGDVRGTKGGDDDYGLYLLRYGRHSRDVNRRHAFLDELADLLRREIDGKSE